MFSFSLLPGLPRVGIIPMSWVLLLLFPAQAHAWQPRHVSIDTLLKETEYLLDKGMYEQAQAKALAAVRQSRTQAVEKWLESTFWLHETQLYLGQATAAIQLLDSTLKAVDAEGLSPAALYQLRRLYYQQAYNFFDTGISYSQARDYFLKTLELYQQNEAFEQNRPNPFQAEEHIHLPLGGIFTRMGDYSRALHHLNLYKSWAVGQKKQAAIIEALSEIGIVYKEQGKYEKAMDTYREALGIKGVPDSVMAYVWVNLANAEREMGQYGAAIRHARQGIAAFERNRKPEATSGSYNILGDVYRDQGAYQQAQAQYEKALQIALATYGSPHRREVAEVYISKGKAAMQQGLYRQAAREYQQALYCVLKGISPKDAYQHPSGETFYAEPLILDALYGQAQAFFRTYQQEKKIDPLKHSLQCHLLVAQMEDSLRQSYTYESSKLHLGRESHRRTEGALEVCYELFRLSGDSTYLRQAFALAERNKAAVLLESIKEAEAIYLSGLPPSLMAEEQLLKKQLVQSRQAARLAELGQAEDYEQLLLQADEAYTAYTRFFAQLTRRYPSLARLSGYQPQRISLQQAQALLPPDSSSMVAYFAGERSLFIFELTPSRFFTHQIPCDAHFPQLIRQFQQALRSPQAEKGYAETAYALYQLLVEPLQAASPYLLVIPDGLLGYVPFDALLTRRVTPGQYNYKSYPYLLFERTISYAYSATLLQELSARKMSQKAPKSFLGIAPVDGDGQLARLKYSEQEIGFVRAHWGGDTLLRNHATKQWFLEHAQEYRMIHISSHARTLDSFPERSHIYFWKGENMDEQDYLLYLYDLYSLQLQAAMVVLSACETGDGQLYEGEGIMSLGRGFILAGCPSLLKTLWSVNHFSTTRIMQAFYEEIFSGKRKDQALRQAKRRYLLKDEGIDKAMAHPYYWAAYTPIGDMEPVEAGGLPAVGWLLLALCGLGAAAVFYWWSKQKR